MEFKQSPNYSKGRGGKKITHIVIHAMAGYYKGSIAWFLNPKAKVSAHYLISKKGEVIQMVKDEDKAWHCNKANGFTIGIELEDRDPGTKKNCLTDPNWCTEIELETAAKLTASLMKKHHIPIDNVVGHDSELMRKYGSLHNDPYKYFPWAKFRDLIEANLGS